MTSPRWGDQPAIVAIMIKLIALGARAERVSAARKAERARRLQALLRDGGEDGGMG